MVDKYNTSYLYQKRGVYYFSKQVPCDVRQHYSRDRIVICLRTKSSSKAMRNNCVIYSFRHSMRDRLRAVECPSDIIDAIGGWTTTGVGQRYGTGQPLEVKAKWMKRLVPL